MAEAEGEAKGIPTIEEVQRRRANEIGTRSIPGHPGRGHILCIRGIHSHQGNNHLAYSGGARRPIVLRVPYGRGSPGHRQNWLHSRHIPTIFLVTSTRQSEALPPRFHSPIRPRLSIYQLQWYLGNADTGRLPGSVSLARWAGSPGDRRLGIPLDGRWVEPPALLRGLCLLLLAHPAGTGNSGLGNDQSSGAPPLPTSIPVASTKARPSDCGVPPNSGERDTADRPLGAGTIGSCANLPKARSLFPASPRAALPCRRGLRSATNLSPGLLGAHPLLEPADAEESTFYRLPTVRSPEDHLRSVRTLSQAISVIRNHSTIISVLAASDTPPANPSHTSTDYFPPASTTHIAPSLPKAQVQAPQ